MFSTFNNFKSGLSDEYYDVLKQGNGRVIIASSLSNEESLVLSGMNNSLFTHYLLLGLSGAAESRNDGVIRVLDLFHFLSEKVPEHDHRQHPIIKAEVENNFPISLYKGGRTKSELAEKINRTPAPSPKYQAGRDIVAPESSITQINITNQD